MIGHTPPPIGGVTVYVKRKMSSLEKDGHFVELLEPSYSIKFIKNLLYIQSRSYDEIILNGFSVIVFIALMMIGVCRKTIVVDHNHSRNFKKNIIKRLIIKKPAY